MYGFYKNVFVQVGPRSGQEASAPITIYYSGLEDRTQITHLASHSTTIREKHKPAASSFVEMTEKTILAIEATGVQVEEHDAAASDEGGNALGSSWHSKTTEPNISSKSSRASSTAAQVGITQRSPFGMRGQEVHRTRHM